MIKVSEEILIEADSDEDNDNELSAKNNFLLNQFKKRNLKPSSSALNKTQTKPKKAEILTK